MGNKLEWKISSETKWVLEIFAFLNNYAKPMKKKMVRHKEE